ncbi:hypothetical protein BLOT_007147 [Blomia tropicalis]|nr:hypothetical protein BLOT_007147 [Blomia tropicalis]
MAGRGTSIGTGNHPPPQLGGVASSVGVGVGVGVGGGRGYSRGGGYPGPGRGVPRGPSNYSFYSGRGRVVRGAGRRGWGRGMRRGGSRGRSRGRSFRGRSFRGRSRGGRSFRGRSRGGRSFRGRSRGGRSFRGRYFRGRSRGGRGRFSRGRRGRGRSFRGGFGVRRGGRSRGGSGMSRFHSSVSMGPGAFSQMSMQPSASGMSISMSARRGGRMSGRGRGRGRGGLRRRNRRRKQMRLKRNPKFASIRRFRRTILKEIIKCESHPLNNTVNHALLDQAVQAHLKKLANEAAKEEYQVKFLKKPDAADSMRLRDRAIADERSGRFWRRAATKFGRLRCKLMPKTPEEMAAFARQAFNSTNVRYRSEWLRYEAPHCMSGGQDIQMYVFRVAKQVVKQRRNQLIRTIRMMRSGGRRGPRGGGPGQQTPPPSPMHNAQNSPSPSTSAGSPASSSSSASSSASSPGAGRKVSRRKKRRDVNLRFRRGIKEFESALFDEAYVLYAGKINVRYLIGTYKRMKKLLMSVGDANVQPWKLVSPAEAEKIRQANEMKRTHGKTGKPHTPGGGGAMDGEINAVTNVLMKVHLPTDLAGTVMARRAIKRGRVIFHEPIIAFKPTRSTFCGACDRYLGSAYQPCELCSRVVFCNLRCFRMGLMTNHKKPACQSYTWTRGLGKESSLIYQLVNRCDAVNNFSVLFEINNQGMAILKNRWLDAKYQAEEGWRHLQLLLLFDKLGTEAYPNPFRNVPASGRKVNASILMEATLLANMIGNNFGAQVHSGKFVEILYQLICFLKCYPPACSKISAMRRGRARFGKKGFGFALGAFGGLFLHRCQGNVRRRLNLRKGRIEYVATKDIAAQEPLYLTWGLSLQKLMWLGVDQSCPDAANCRLCAKLKTKRERIAALRANRMSRKGRNHSMSGGSSTPTNSMNTPSTSGSSTSFSS